MSWGGRKRSGSLARVRKDTSTVRRFHANDGIATVIQADRDLALGPLLRRCRFRHVIPERLLNLLALVLPRRAFERFFRTGDPANISFEVCHQLNHSDGAYHHLS